MAEADTTTIKVIIRQSSGDQTEIQVAPDATIADLKAKVQEALSVAPEAQRLIFKGK